jgi:hypothetical protein
MLHFEFFISIGEGFENNNSEESRFDTLKATCLSLKKIKKREREARRTLEEFGRMKFFFQYL